ncbi:unnamed protein product [Linum trigynum]|uniref:Uncharacterized protein n=1 Tax=Linum trigynum TaxID=586398 RepID=A0AAV2FPE8_9ROSI
MFLESRIEYPSSKQDQDHDRYPARIAEPFPILQAKPAIQCPSLSRSSPPAEMVPGPAPSVLSLQSSSLGGLVMASLSMLLSSKFSSSPWP